MLEYIYFVKRPGCEDEPFDFFNQAESFALGCLTEKPIITQIEVERNDFGECVNSCDLGTIWSWEDLMSKPDTETGETLFSKDETFGISEDLLNTVPSDLGQLLRDKEAEFSTQTSEDRANSVRQLAVNKLNFLNTIQPANKVESDVLSQGKALMQRIIDAPLLTNRDCDDFLIQFYDFEEFFNSIDALSGMDQFVEKDLAEISLSEPMDIENAEPVTNLPTDHPESESIPTIEELVEMMEENEDTVECKWCNELFDKSECRKEVDLGWLCSRCEEAIKSRGETLTFIENDYCDSLDEKLDIDIDFSQCIDSSDMEIWGVEPIGENTYKAVLLKRYENVPFRGINYPDEINRIESEMFDLGGLFVFHFGKDGLPCLGRWDPELLNSMGTCEIIFDDTSYDLACEKAINNVTAKTEELEVTHDLGNEYDGAYPDYKPELSKVDETPDVSDSHLRLCPECGKDTFDVETGICLDCGFN